MKKLALGVVAATLLPLAALPAAKAAQPAGAPSAKEVLTTYADLAHAGYDDALTTAKTLKTAVDALIANPSDQTLKAARDAWKAARVPYLQTEAFRFGNPIVDEWEGNVNSWPLDEGLIDYVDSGYAAGENNPYGKANVIANPKLKIAGKAIDATKIDGKLLSKKLHQAGKVEANVATGYHAIEFLLWGQDLNGTGPGAGNRPATDYSLTNCTGGHCDRRAQYLSSAAGLLVDDLAEMVKAWGEKGKARSSIVKAGEKEGFGRILTGLGSLSYGELAGERMKLGLMLHDPEEEQDCFSDNTHNSHFYDEQGMVNVFNGSYKRVDGSVVSGPSLAAYVTAKAPEAAAKTKAAMDAAVTAFTAIKTTADSGKMAYDQMIGANNPEGNALVATAIDRLLDQKKALEGVVAALGVNVAIKGSDSLDAPDKVQK